MAILATGLAVFFAAHVIPIAPSLRDAATKPLGVGGRKILVSLLSAAGFALIIWGKAEAPFVAVFDPPAWGRMATHAVMPLAFVFLVAAYAPANRIRAGVRHPMLLAVVLWAAGHLAANGDLASLLLFGGFATYALVDLGAAARRPAARPKVGSWIADAGVVVIGLVIYVAVLHAHPILFGVRALT